MDDDVILQICTQDCGAKCCGGDIFLARQDMDRLQESGKSGFDTMRDGIRVMETDNQDTCVFLDDDNRCSVYEHRPLDCQLYPFGFKLDGDEVLLVLAECPLSEQMSCGLREEMEATAKTLIGKYSEQELQAYDELSFTTEYTVVDRIPLAEVV